MYRHLRLMWLSRNHRQERRLQQLQLRLRLHVRLITVVSRKPQPPAQVA